jgi:formylglycine-generating enzyme required for sulfatase activity
VDPRDPQRTSPVGRLKPNPLGLYDIYGNVWEWTQTRTLPYPDGVHVDVEDDVLVVSDSTPRIRRSGGFPYEAAAMRSAARGTRNALPHQRRDNVGFRVARTIR